MKIFQEGMLKQVGGMFLTHICTVVIGMVFAFMFTTVVTRSSLIHQIFSAIYTLVYFVVLFSQAWEFAQYDKKSFTTTSVYLLKGAVLPIGILILNLILWAAYAFAWRYLTIDGVLATGTGMLYNVIYVIDTFMYSGFVKIANGSVPLTAHLLIVLVPLIASTAGYISGVKGLTLMDKIMPFIYEKKAK